MNFGEEDLIFEIALNEVNNGEVLVTFAEGDQEFCLDFGEVAVVHHTGVSSVNGKTGDVILDADDVGAYSKDESDLKIKSGAGAPTSETSGVLGTIYNDTTTGNKYVCISVGDGVYSWERRRIPELGQIEEGNTGYVTGGQVHEYNKDNIVFRRY